MLRRGIERIAGRQTDIMIPLRSILLIEPGQGAQARGESPRGQYDAAWPEAGESDPTAVLAAPIAGRDMPSAPSRRVAATARASIAKSVGEKWAN
jgi:hypothetical protein